ncbi:MAG: glycosyltransferase family 4 protein [Parcubacteria group bacterium]|nr:glycosyltransferase family 4 protein [Parcubacteria group bacterium]
MNDPRPRILIFSLAYFPLVGGAEIAVKEIADRLGDVFDFDLITLGFGKDWPKEEKIGQTRVFRVKKGFILPKLTFALKGAILAHKLHSRSQYQLIWPIMAAYAGLAGLLFKFLHPKIPLLLTLQEGDSESHILKRVGVFYPLWRLIFKKADYIQAISNYLAGFARRHGARCPVEIVPNGVNLKNFQFPISNFQLNSKFQTSSKFQAPSSKTIITTSRLVYKNGIDILIRAAADLKFQAPSSKFQVLIVGDGPDRSKLEKLAADLAVSDRIKFVGHIDPDLIPGYLAQADIFVRPSRSEGLGNSFLEAMAAGLPIVGTAVGGITDFLKDGETGLVCQVDDSNDLAEKIVKVLSDAELSHKLAENGRRLVETGYSWDKIASKMKAILNSLYPKPYTLYPIPYTPNPRILLATGIYPPEIGGPATYAVLLEKELPKRGIGVSVLPFRAVRNWPKGLRHLLYFIKATRLCRGHDLILAQDTISVGLPSLLAAKLLRKRFLIRVPGDYVWEQSVQRFGVKDSIDDFQHPNSAPSPGGFGNTKAPTRIKRYPWRVEFLRSVQKFVVNHADTVITPSIYFRDLVRSWVKDKNKVITIYNGIDLSIYEPTLHPKPYTLKTIVSAGRLVPWKGFDMVIEMMRDLPEWRLVIIGDGPERENLQLLITNYQLQNRVTLTGAIPREKVLEYLMQAKIFVLNTSFESFSFQIVEAMSLGLPVIASNIGNLAEIIENGVDGMLVEPNNKEQFLAAVARLERDEGFRKSISEQARVKAQNFSLERTLAALENLLRNLLP